MKWNLLLVMAVEGSLLFGCLNTNITQTESEEASKTGEEPIPGNLNKSGTYNYDWLPIDFIYPMRQFAHHYYSNTVLGMANHLTHSVGGYGIVRWNMETFEPEGSPIGYGVDMATHGSCRDLWVVSKSGDIYLSKNLGQSWISNGRAIGKRIAMGGENCDQVYLIGKYDNTVYKYRNYYANYPSNPNWQKSLIKAKDIAVDNKGTPWTLELNNDIRRYVIFSEYKYYSDFHGNAESNVTAIEAGKENEVFVAKGKKVSGTQRGLYKWKGYASLDFFDSFEKVNSVGWVNYSQEVSVSGSGSPLAGYGNQFYAADMNGDGEPFNRP